MPLTRREAMVMTAYTGVTMVNFGDFQGFCEQVLGRPVWTHELGVESVWDELKAKTKDEFLAICDAVPTEVEPWEKGEPFTDEQKSEGLRKMLDHLPKDKDIVLLAMEGGDE